MAVDKLVFLVSAFHMEYTGTWVRQARLKETFRQLRMPEKNRLKLIVSLTLLI
jgi:hypothetical protein